MKKNYSSMMMMMAALLAAGAAMTACSDDKSIEEKSPQKTYQLVIDGTKGSEALTRALTQTGGPGNPIIASWKTTDNIKVWKGTERGTLHPVTNGVTAKFTGTISGNDYVAGTTTFSLFSPSEDQDYTGQDGTLEKIATNYDYIIGNAKVTEVDGSGGIVKAVDASGSGPVKFEAYQAIVLFKLYNKADNSAINATKLTVSGKNGVNERLIQTYPNVGSPTPGSIEINTSGTTNLIYAALSQYDSGESLIYTLTAEAGGKTYTYTTSGNKTFSWGKYYEVEVKMTETTP